MFKTEADVINWLYTFSPSKNGRTLDHLHTTLAALDNPHRKIKTIHIAGTNGKGSTVAYLREALMKSGYKVATFTSPYIISFGERMSINNVPISETDLVKYANLLKKQLPENTDEYASFDLITLISFLYFASAVVDVVVYETGIGGRLDSTNVITPLACAITNVGHDHADVLGETQLERLNEKLGIAKKGVPLFTTEEDPVLLDVVRHTCQTKEVKPIFPLEVSNLLSIGLDGTKFSYKSDVMEINMHGAHQFKNAVLAVAILDYLTGVTGFENVDPKKVKNAVWQGRFEHMSHAPPVVLDGAHNLEGIKALIDALEKIYPKHRKKIMFSAIATKDAKKMVLILSEVAQKLVFTKGTHPESIDPETLVTYLANVPYHIYHDYEKAIDLEMNQLEVDEILVVCGSLYFISDARSYLRKSISN